MRDYDIESDLKQEKFQSIKLVQGDRGNKIKINVYEDGQPVNLAGCSVTAKYKRADGEIINDGVIENIYDNSFDAVMDSSITKVAGTLKMLFTIEKDAVKVSAFLLLADVRKGIGESSSSGGSAGGGEVTVDLSDYYKKIETYSRKEIDAQFKDIANQIVNDTENSKIIPFNYINSSGSSSDLFDASKAFNGNLAIHNTEGNGWINKTSDRWIKFTLPIGVIIGDSIAEGHKSTHGRLHLSDGSYNLDKLNESGQMSFHLELLTGLKFVNHGIGGQRTDEILARFDRDVLAKTTTLVPSKTLDYKPSLIVVSAGVNDILQNKSYENIISNLKSMMDICKENKIYAIFNTIGYFNSVTPTQEQIEKIDKINNWLKLQCDKSKYIKCYDYNNFIKSEVHGFPNESLLQDKIHPTKETYRKMAEQIYYTYLRNNNVNIIPQYITISTQVSPEGLFAGLSRPLQIIVTYNDDKYSYVYVLDNKPIVNIPIPNDVSRPINNIKLTISTGQSPIEVSSLTSPSSNFYISEIYGTSSLTQENIIAKGLGYLVENVPDGLSSGRLMISDSEYSKEDNLRLYGVTTGDTTSNKLLVMSGTCIIESSEELSPNDFIITTTRGKCKKSTNFGTENLIARVVKNAGSGNPLEYICEILR